MGRLGEQLQDLPQSGEEGSGDHFTKPGERAGGGWEKEKWGKEIWEGLVVQASGLPRYRRTSWPGETPAPQVAK
jgi:hypothetical protein